MERPFDRAASQVLELCSDRRRFGPGAQEPRCGLLRAASPLSLASTLTLKLKTYRAHLAVQMNLDWPENVYTLLAYLGLLDFDVDVSS